MKHWGGLAEPTPPVTLQKALQVQLQVDATASCSRGQILGFLPDTVLPHLHIQHTGCFQLQLSNKIQNSCFPYTPVHPALSLKKRDDIAEQVCNATQQSQDKLQLLSPKPELFLGELICRSSFSFKQRPEEFSWRLLRLDCDDLSAPNAFLSMRKSMFHLVSNFCCKMLGPTTSIKFHSPSLCLSDLSLQ